MAFEPTLVYVSGYPQDAEQTTVPTQFGEVEIVRATLKARPGDKYGYKIEAMVGELGDALLKAVEGKTGFAGLVTLITIRGKDDKAPWAKMQVRELVGK